MRKKKSNSATPFCKACFKDIRTNTLHATFAKNVSLCYRCYQNLEPVCRHFRCKGVPFLSLFNYHQGFQTMLFQFKGCHDIELAPCFLEYALPYLKFRYRGYVLVPAPSSKSHNEARGFNHVIEAFRPLGLPILEILEKKTDRKQTDCTVKERKEVGKILGYTKKISLRGKKILFVDDVYTTGSTAKACLALLSALHPSRLEGLVLSKVIPK